MRIASVVGARPQFIKAAMVSAALRECGIDEVMIHTGQHYDHEMSALFFQQLGIADPAFNLGVGSGSHGVQTARILEGVEGVLLHERAELLLVYGDTNSTVGGALAAAKLHIPVAHVEAGLRSYNRRMPEEINRVVTDHISDLLFVPTALAAENLRGEGIAEEKIHVTGDVMLDAVLRFRGAYEAERARLLARLALRQGEYFVATIHRAENTDEEGRLRAIASAFATIGREVGTVVFPLHPRTRAKLGELGMELGPGVLLIDPTGYLEMQALLSGARGVLTDSGGVQKEAAFHGLPTLTLRDETEWPETLQCGGNVLVGADAERIVAAARHTTGRIAPPPGFGRGDAGRIIATTIRDWRNGQ